MKKIRLFSVLLATGLLFTSTACVNGDTDGTGTTAPAQTTTQGETDEETSDETDEETVDTTDEVTDDTTVPVGEESVIRIMGPESSNPYVKFDERDRYSSWQEFEKLFQEKNLRPEFEIIATDQYQTTIQTRMASATDLAEFTNFAYLDDASILDYAVRRVILPINPIIEEHSDGTAKAFFAEDPGRRSQVLNTMEDGNAYWISQIQTTTYDGEPASTSMGVLVRRDWLSEAGLEMPQSTEEFKAMLQTFQDEDMNGNGQPDETLALDPSFGDGISQWFGIHAGLISFNLQDMEVTSGWYQEGVQDYFRFMQELVEAGLVDTSLFGLDTAAQMDATIASNRASAIYSYTMQTWYEASIAEEGAEYVQVPPFDAVDGIPGMLAVEPPALSYGRWGFTQALEDEAAAGKLLDILTSDAYTELTQWGVEGVSFEVVDGENVLLPIALNDAWEQAAEEGASIGDSLWANGSMFPKRRFVPMENEMSVVPGYKSESQEGLFGYEHTTPLGTENYLPVPTSEQVEQRVLLITDLTTQSDQLMTQLILNQISLDDWDDHIASLKALGLDDLIAIDQARMDRYLGGLD